MACPGDVYAADCSARDALALISGKWVMLLLPALAQGPLRNGALLRKIEGISQKVLTQTLRQLERNGPSSGVSWAKATACGVPADRSRAWPG